MAKETPVVQNSKMLLISMGLGLLVVVLYNVQINIIRNEGSKDMVNLLQYKLEKRAGDTISAKDDIMVVPVPKQYEKAWKSVLNESDYLNTTAQGIVGKKLVRGVSKGDWVFREDFPNEARNQKDLPPPGLVQIEIPVNAKLSTGGTLRLSMPVNVLGEVQVSQGLYKTMTLMEGLIVRAIDGRGLNDPNPGNVSSGNIRSIQVQVPKPVARQFFTLLTHVKGQQVVVQIASSTDLKEAKDVVISEEVPKALLEKADPSSGIPTIPGGTGGPPVLPF